MDEKKYAEAFKEPDTRKSFIAKVYMILTLFFTIGVVSLFVCIADVRHFAHKHWYLFWIAVALTFGILITMSCFQSLRRNPPQNYILLIIFTICESFLVGLMTCHYHTDLILLALGITTAVIVVLTLFAIQTTFDFTIYGGLLLTFLIILIVLAIVGIFYHNKIFSTIYACLGVFIFSGYLIYDTQLLMGGRKNALSEREYVFAALSIYIDVVHLFRHILSLLGMGAK